LGWDFSGPFSARQARGFFSGKFLFFFWKNPVKYFTAESAGKNFWQGLVDPENFFKQGSWGCREFFEQGLIKKFSAGSAQFILSRVWL
jgi:hypothetical protein